VLFYLGKARMAGKYKDFADILTVDQKKENINELSTDSQVVFGLLTLIVDINYRVKYGEVVNHRIGKGYRK
jgi:hypothetical protein